MAILSVFTAAASAYSLSAGLRTPQRAAAASVQMAYDQEKFIAESKEMRLKHLEEQASERAPSRVPRDPPTRPVSAGLAAWRDARPRALPPRH